jgi:hypothetical protein
MSLDFVVLDDRDGVGRSVPIGVDAHHRLVGLCKGESFELLARFGDYYSEGEIFWQELDRLDAELHVAWSRAMNDKELRRTMEQLIELMRFARKEKRSILAVPD